MLTRQIGSPGFIYEVREKFEQAGKVSKPAENFGSNLLLRFPWPFAE